MARNKGMHRKSGRIDTVPFISFHIQEIYSTKCIQSTDRHVLPTPCSRHSALYSYGPSYKDMFSSSTEIPQSGDSSNHMPCCSTGVTRSKGLNRKGGRIDVHNAIHFTLCHTQEICSTNDIQGCQLRCTAMDHRTQRTE